MRATALVLALAACEAAPPPRAPVVAARAAARNAAAAATAAPALKDSYVYSPIGKRDPFRSPLEDLAVAKTTVGRCPLCRWSVDQLKLVAVITGTGNPVGMVEDPDGVGHIVRPGTSVGRVGGRVSSIQRDAIVVTELSHDPFGKVTRNRTELRIQQAVPAADQNATSLLDE